MNSLFKTVIGCASAPVKENTDVVPLSQNEANTQKIFVRDLALDMFIGVMDEEKSAKQRVFVSADISVKANNNWRADEVNNVLSYADIIEEIKALADKGHIQLVETFAEMIAEICLQHREVTQATISVEKPDIIAEVKSVGAQITRVKG